MAGAVVVWGDEGSGFGEVDGSGDGSEWIRESVSLFCGCRDDS